MICITLRLIVKPERVDGLLDTMRRLIPEVRKEPGNHAYFFHRVPGTSNDSCSTNSTRTRRHCWRTASTSPAMAST